MNSNCLIEFFTLPVFISFSFLVLFFFFFFFFFFFAASILPNLAVKQKCDDATMGYTQSIKYTRVDISTSFKGNSN